MTTSVKTCFKCGEEKPLNDFYRHPMMGDGRLNKCKSCTKKDVRMNRRKRIDYYREYDRQRGNRQGYEYVKQYRNKNGYKYAAHRAVDNAVRSGSLKRPENCEQCGVSCTPHGHHDDYAKPLDVRWLCAACHRQWHIENGEGKNADAPIEQMEDAA